MTTYVSFIDSNGKEWRMYATTDGAYDTVAVTDGFYSPWTSESYDIDELWTDPTYIIP